MLRPSFERFPLLVDVLVHVVGSLDSLARVIENSLSDVDLNAYPCEAGSSRATQVVRGEGGDTVFLESFETSGDAPGDVLRIRRRRSVGVRKHIPRAVCYHLELLKRLDRPI